MYIINVCVNCLTKFRNRHCFRILKRQALINQMDDFAKGWSDSVWVQQGGHSPGNQGKVRESEKG